MNAPRHAVRERCMCDDGWVAWAGQKLLRKREARRRGEPRAQPCAQRAARFSCCLAVLLAHQGPQSPTITGNATRHSRTPARHPCIETPLPDFLLSTASICSRPIFSSAPLGPTRPQPTSRSAGGCKRAGPPWPRRFARQHLGLQSPWPVSPSPLHLSLIHI